MSYDINQCKLCSYARVNLFIVYQRIAHTLRIRKIYAEYTRHKLDTVE